MQPHKKKNQRLDPQDLVKFEWEKVQEKLELEEKRKAAEYAMKLYKII